MVEWRDMAAASYAANKDTLAIARKARQLNQAIWPPADVEGNYFKRTEDLKIGASYYTRTRHLANHLADAALYVHTQRNDAAAMGYLLDMLHLAAMVDGDAPPADVRSLVAIGIGSFAAQRTTLIASGVRIGEGEGGLPVKFANELVTQLLAIPPVDEAAIQATEFDHPASRPRLLESHRIYRLDRHFAALTLACQLYHHDTDRWPQTADDLVPKYVPSSPLDPWNDNKPLGYVVIKNGLPDGGDRPLFYSHRKADDGLHYRVDQPSFSFYQVDGTDRPMNRQIKGGQFREVIRWTPPDPKPNPTIVPLVLK